MFNELKEDILKEFKKVAKVLHSCNLVVNSSVVNPFILNSEDLFSKDNKEIEQLLNPVCRSFTNNVIYKIELLEVINKAEVFKSFQKAKCNKIENRAYCKYNEENTPTILNGTNKTITLYIGSSNKKRVYTRMRCHLGIGAIRTYGMHLKSWLPKNQKYKVSITFLELNCTSDIVSKTNVLELVEEALWNKEKPLLGKKSGLL